MSIAHRLVPILPSTTLACSLLSALALLFLSLFLISRLSREGRHPLLVRLQQHPLVFGLDNLYQDFRDLHNHNSSNRSLARHNKHGQTYLSSLLGQSTIHTIDPSNIHAVTTERFADFEKGAWARTIAKYMGHGILVNDGSAWHASRILLKPLFKRNRTADVRMLETHADRLVEFLRSREGGFVYFKRAAQMVVLDITTEMLTGKSTLSLAGLLSDAITVDGGGSTNGPVLLDLIDELEPYGNTAIELGPFSLHIFAFRYRKIMALIRGIQRFFETAVCEAQLAIQHRGRDEPGSENSNIIEELLAQDMMPHQVQGELQNIFFAAFDTTTALIANLFDCMGRHPRIVKRIQTELALVVGSGMIAETDIARLTYLRDSIFETLRLHSPVTYHTRKSKRDTVLPCGGGLDGKFPIFVRRGTCVTWSTYALNRQAGIFGEDWMDFRPERWLLDEGKGISLQSKEEFIPFGSGPRNCLGQQFAMLQTSYIAARVLAAFENFQLRDEDMPFQEAAAVTHWNGLGTWIKFQ